MIDYAEFQIGENLELHFKYNDADGSDCTFETVGSGSMYSRTSDFVLIRSTDVSRTSYTDWITRTYYEGTINCDNVCNYFLSSFGVYINKLVLNVNTIGANSFDLTGYPASYYCYINEIDGTFNSVGDNAFNGCIMTEFNLNNVEFQSFGEASFKDCKKLTSINIGSAQLKSRTFENCELLSNIGSGILNINVDAYSTFHNCVSLMSLNFPDETNVHNCNNKDSIFYIDNDKIPYDPNNVPIRTTVTTDIRKLYEFNWLTCNRYVDFNTNIKVLLFIKHKNNWIAYIGYPNTIGWNNVQIQRTVNVKHNNTYYYFPTDQTYWNPSAGFSPSFDSDEVYIAKPGSNRYDYGYWLKLLNKITDITPYVDNNGRRIQ